MSLRNVDLEDVLGLVGLVLVGVGLWLIYPPAALVVVGALLLLLAWRLARARAARTAGNDSTVPAWPTSSER